MLRLRFVAPVHVCHRLQEHLTTAVHPVERALPVCPSCTDVTGISSALACIVSFILFLRREFQVEVLSPGVCILVLKTTAFRFPASWYFELLIYFEAIMCFPEHICDCWCLEVSVIYMWCTASSQLHLCQLRCLVGVSVYMWRKKKKSNEPFISYVEKLLQACSWPVVHCDVYCNLCCSISQWFFSFLLAKHWSIVGKVPNWTFPFFFLRNEKGGLLS